MNRPIFVTHRLMVNEIALANRYFTQCLLFSCNFSSQNWVKAAVLLT